MYNSYEKWIIQNILNNDSISQKKRKENQELLDNITYFENSQLGQSLISKIPASLKNMISSAMLEGERSLKNNKKVEEKIILIEKEMEKEISKKIFPSGEISSKKKGDKIRFFPSEESEYINYYKDKEMFNLWHRYDAYNNLSEIELSFYTTSTNHTNKFELFRLKHLGELAKYIDSDKGCDFIKNSFLKIEKYKKVNMMANTYKTDIFSINKKIQKIFMNNLVGETIKFDLKHNKNRGVLLPQYKNTLSNKIKFHKINPVRSRVSLNGGELIYMETIEITRLIERITKGILKIK